ncbi:ABC transporter substrate-binding protein [Knoellia sp. CPCC 206435]|uniref:ABC transporter substrate-binding protein n=1 Tax=Knoellia terrae TaxID=3404797 RepID=UPI003B42CE0D
MSPSASSSDLSRRLLLTSIGALGASAALSACSGGSSTPPGAAPSSGSFGEGDKYEGPKVALAFWNGFTGGDGPFMKKMVDEFNTANPNVTVSMNTLQWADFYAKVPTAVASGAGPDVACMHIDQLATNAARRVIVPLDEIATGLKLEEDDFAPVVWNAGEYKDQRYGIPLDIHPLGFYVNKSLMTKAGITEIPTDRAGFEAAVTELKGKAGVATPFWVTATWPAHLIFTSLIAQFGGSIFDEDGAKATFNSDAGVESLEWMRTFIENGSSPKNVSNDAQAVAFRQQRNALTFDGIWMMNEWAKVKGLEWEAAKFPTIGDKPAVWASSHNFVVTSQSAKDQNKLAASRAFISYISGKSLEWAKSGQIPARASVRDSAEFKELKVQSTLAEQLPDVQFPPSVPGIGGVVAPTYEAAVNEVILGKKEPKAALDEAAKKADSLLEADRSKYQG